MSAASPYVTFPDSPQLLLSSSRKFLGRPSSPALLSFRIPIPRISAAHTSAAQRETSNPVAMAAPAPSFYQVLGLGASATEQEIKAAYRKLARTCHPDVAAVDRKGTSADRFMRIHTAYSTLSDPEKRADYDRSLLLNRRVVSGVNPVSSPQSSSSFPGFTKRRTWETDQCW